MEALENKEVWLTEFEQGWLAHYQENGEIDWTKYNRPRNKTSIPGPGIDLSASRLILVSSAGGYLPTQDAPFDAANPLGDYSIRSFPSNTPLETLAYAHDHYDHAAVKQDPQVLLPLGHLQEMVNAGKIGSLAPSVASFMGYQPNVTRVVEETAQAILDLAQKEHTQAALLIPA